VKVFNLLRKEDESGVSGTGIVAQGVIFDDGTVAMKWLVEPRGLNVYTSIADVDIHSHGGRTLVVAASVEDLN
jgi:hypothetical protein